MFFGAIPRDICRDFFMVCLDAKLAHNHRSKRAFAVPWHFGYYHDHLSSYQVRISDRFNDPRVPSSLVEKLPRSARILSIESGSIRGSGCMMCLRSSAHHCGTIPGNAGLAKPETAQVLNPDARSQQARGKGPEILIEC